MEDCKLCNLHNTRNKIVNPRGSETPTLYLVGLAPGPIEDSQGLPFVGPAGQKLWSILASVGLDDKKVRVGNLCRCIPKDPNSQESFRDPTSDEINTCIQFLHQDINRTKPKVIVALGNIPKGALGSTYTGITTERGKTFETTILGKTYPVIPSFHPSYIERNSQDKSLEAKLRIDLIKALRISSGEQIVDASIEIVYDINRMKEIVYEILNNGDDYVAYDTETSSLQQNAPNFKLVGLSISDGKKGYYFPVYNVDRHISDPDFQTLKLIILHLLKTKKVISHNCKFDSNVNLAVFGETYFCTIDTMIYHHGLYAGMDYSNGLKEISQRLLNVDDWEGDRKIFEVFLGNCYHAKTMNNEVYSGICNNPKFLKIKKFIDIYPLSYIERFRTEYEPDSDGKISFYWYPIELLGLYGAIDPLYTYKLGMIFKSELEKAADAKPAIDLMMDCQHVFADIEQGGFRIDLSRRDETQKQIDDKLNDTVSRVRQYDAVIKWELDQTVKIVLGQLQKYVKYLEPILSKPRVSIDIVNNKRVSVSKPGITAEDFNKEISERLNAFVQDWRINNNNNLDILVDRLKYIVEKTCDLHGALDDCTTILNRMKKFVKIKSYEVFMPSSYVQLGVILYNKEYLGIEVDKLHKETPTAAPTLEYIRLKYKNTHIDTFIELVQIFKKNWKAKSDMDAFDRATITTNNISLARCDYLVHGTKTGRFSTAGGYGKIGVHTIPDLSPVRNMIISKYYEDGGVILGGDQSQLELRILASLAYLLCKDANMIKDFKKGLDFHQTAAATARRIDYDKVTKAQRRDAKAISFGIIYGKGKHSLAEELGTDAKHVEELFNLYFGAYPGVSGYIEFIHKVVKKFGYVIFPTGRKRWFPEINNPNNARGMVEALLRQAQNNPIQGSASDITARMIVRLHELYKRKNIKTTLPFYIHDYIGQDVFPGELPISLLMTKLLFESRVYKEFEWVSCPLRLDMSIGTTWLNKIDIKEVNIIDNGIDIKIKGKLKNLKEILDQLGKAYDLEFGDFGKSIEEEDEDFYNLMRLYHYNPPTQYEAFHGNLSVKTRDPYIKDLIEEVREEWENMKKKT